MVREGQKFSFVKNYWPKSRKLVSSKSFFWYVVLLPLWFYNVSHTLGVPYLSRQLHVISPFWWSPQLRYHLPPPIGVYPRPTPRCRRVIVYTVSTSSYSSREVFPISVTMIVLPGTSNSSSGYVLSFNCHSTVSYSPDYVQHSVFSLQQIFLAHPPLLSSSDHSVSLQLGYSVTSFLLISVPWVPLYNLYKIFAHDLIWDTET